MRGQDRFVARHSESWDALEMALDRLEGGQTVAAPDFPQSYRRLCQQLAELVGIDGSAPVLVEGVESLPAGLNLLHRKHCVKVSRAAELSPPSEVVV